MNIVIASDHRGYECKAYLKQYVVGENDPIVWIDMGTHSKERTDYPLYAQAASRAVLNGDADRAILICASGIGMAIVANRFPGLFAGVAWNESVAKQSKEDDNVNILSIPCDYVSCEQAAAIVIAWLKAEFKEGRYQERIEMINGLDTL